MTFFVCSVTFFVFSTAYSLSTSIITKKSKSVCYIKEMIKTANFSILQELIYVWNGYNIVGKNSQLLEKMLEDVEKTVTEIANKKGQCSTVS